LEGFRFEEHEHSPKGIVRRNTIFQWNELLKPFDLGFAEGSDIFVGLGAAEDGDEGDEEDFTQGIVARAGSGIVDGLDGVEESDGSSGDFCLAVLLSNEIRMRLPIFFMFSIFTHTPSLERKSGSIAQKSTTAKSKKITPLA